METCSEEVRGNFACRGRLEGDSRWTQAKPPEAVDGRDTRRLAQKSICLADRAASKAPLDAGVVIACTAVIDHWVVASPSKPERVSDAVRAGRTLREMAG